MCSNSALIHRIIQRKSRGQKFISDKEALKGVVDEKIRRFFRAVLKYVDPFASFYFVFQLNCPFLVRIILHVTGIPMVAIPGVSCK